MENARPSNGGASTGDVDSGEAKPTRHDNHQLEMEKIKRVNDKPIALLLLLPVDDRLTEG